MLLGRPKTEEERRKTHKAIYGNTKLPLRGTGLKIREKYKQSLKGRS